MSKILLTYHTPAYDELNAITAMSRRAWCSTRPEWRYVELKEETNTQVDAEGVERPTLDTWKCYEAAYSWLENGIHVPGPDGKMIDIDDVDEILKMDSDTMITNLKMELPPDERPHDGKFIVSEDIYGINVGTVIMRKGQLLTEFLYTMCSLGRQFFWSNQWKEQACIRWLRSDFERYRDCLQLVPQRAINSYVNAEYGRSEKWVGNWEPGDFAVQFPGLPMARRIELANKMLKEATFAE